MRNINLWIGMLAILFTMTSCDLEGIFSSGGKTDTTLNFSTKSVEEQKQQLESEGIAFIDAMLELQETRLFPVIEYALEFMESVLEETELEEIVPEFRNSPVQAGFNFQKKMRAKAEDYDDIWGHYVYNFETNEIELVNELVDQIVVEFPASAEQTTNNGKLVLNVTSSDVQVPFTEEEEDGPFYYPAEMYLSLTVDKDELFYADLKNSFYDDGTPQNIRQSLKIDDFKWVTTIGNTKKKLSEVLQFQKGKTTLIGSAAEIIGKTDLESIMDIIEEEDYPYGLLDAFLGSINMMDVGVKWQLKNVDNLIRAIETMNETDLSEQEESELLAQTLNENMDITAYFLKEGRKFADIDFQVFEEIYGDEYVDYYIIPMFVLSDGSKVHPEDYIMEGFENLFTYIEELMQQFEGDDEAPR